MTDMTAPQSRHVSAMGTRRRTDRAAAVVLALGGVALLASAALTFAQVLPAILGAEGEHMAGDATLWVMLVSLPMTVGGLIALLGAGLLWRGSSGGVTLALLWVAVSGLACAITFIATGNILSAVRMILVESGGWSVSWPELEIYPASGGTWYSALDDVTFWIPGIVAVGAFLVASFLLAGWIAGRARGARSD
jgi:hypothetical protein